MKKKIKCKEVVGKVCEIIKGKIKCRKKKMKICVEK
jgi:hypothetical protein